MPGYADGAGTQELALFRAAAVQAERWAGGPEAAGLDLAGLEKQAVALVRELVRLLLQGHLDLRAVREERLAEVTGPDGIRRGRAEKDRARPLVTVAGPVTVTRTGYRAPGASIVYPADEQLRLPAGKYSPGLGELAAIETARGSVEAAMAAVARATGAAIPKRQFEELVRRAAADAGSFYGRPGRPAPAAVPGSVLVLEADGKGIRMLPGSLRPRTARLAARAAPEQDSRLSRGQVRTRKRMAETGAVFDWAPAPRGIDDILRPAPPDGAEPAGAARAPRAAGKWLTASVARDAAAVIADVFAEADRRDPHRERTWIALADGNKDQLAHIQAQAAARGIEVPVITGFIHVTEYLQNAAWCFHPEGSPDAGRWVREHARAILGGLACQVAAAISAQAAATAGLPKTKHAAAARTARYLQAKARHLGYPTALASGWPVSTGVIEGACRYLVKDRMDITGARWSTDGAEAILQLRAILANGDQDAYRAWHSCHEHRRTYRNHQNCYQLAA